MDFEVKGYLIELIQDTESLREAVHRHWQDTHNADNIGKIADLNNNIIDACKVLLSIETEANLTIATRDNSLFSEEIQMLDMVLEKLKLKRFK